MSRRKIKQRPLKKNSKASQSGSKGPQRRDISLDELKRIIEKSKAILSSEEVETLDGAIDTLAVVTNELEMKGASVRRLRRLLFGPSSEKTSSVFPEENKPLLDDLKAWFEQQFKEKNIEPNGSLGKAINYMTGRWDNMTLFLKVKGAPIDNNACEQIIKKAVLHRKNALFFKTENGAYVGDLFMTIIHTCELEGVNPFDYMMNVAKNPIDIALKPELWMPWNLQINLE